MDTIISLLKSVVASLLGVAMILIGSMLNSYITIPMAIVGIVTCLFAAVYAFSLKSQSNEEKNEKTDGQDKTKNPLEK